MGKIELILLCCSLRRISICIGQIHLLICLKLRKQCSSLEKKIHEKIFEVEMQEFLTVNSSPLNHLFITCQRGSLTAKNT